MMANLHLPESPVCVPDGVEESPPPVGALSSHLLHNDGEGLAVLHKGENIHGQLLQMG